ncbi:MAG: helix-turn-helix domain-containing protein [Anaerolineales bacterium]|jgi:hypothetical protein
MDKSGSLFEIMRQFEGCEGALTTRQVADALGKEPSAVSGMLDTLVQMGRLTALDSSGCDLCPLRAACAFTDTSSQCYCLKDKHAD